MAATRWSILLLVSAAVFCSPAAGQPVLDIAGKPLERGSLYNILPVFRGMGGGLTADGRNGTLCPLFVAQDALEVNSGIAWRFTPANPAATTIQLGADANIDFPGVTICIQSHVWELQGIGSGNNLYVSFSGSRGNPGAGTLSSWFNIQRSGTGSRDYKLVFCPKVCSVCRPRCGDIGIFFEEGKRWLGLGGSPFPVMFRKGIGIFVDADKKWFFLGGSPFPVMFKKATNV